MCAPSASGARSSFARRTRGPAWARCRRLRRRRIKTVCLVPLVSNNRAVGVLGLYHARDQEWPEDELALAQSFANQAAVAISNARLYRSVADQAARIRSIQDLSARLNRLTDVQAIADAIVAEASTLAEYHDIRVYTVDWERASASRSPSPTGCSATATSGSALRVNIGEGSFTGWVAENGEPILVNDALNDSAGTPSRGPMTSRSRCWWCRCCSRADRWA